MLLIALAAFLFAYFYEYVGGKQREEEKEKSELLFTSFNAEKIIRISIKKFDSPIPLVISKKENDYHIEQPVQTKAERTSVESMFNEIKNIKLENFNIFVCGMSFFSLIFVFLQNTFNIQPFCRGTA